MTGAVRHAGVCVIRLGFERGFCETVAAQGLAGERGPRGVLRPEGFVRRALSRVGVSFASGLFPLRLVLVQADDVPLIPTEHPLDADGRIAFEVPPSTDSLGCGIVGLLRGMTQGGSAFWPTLPPLVESRDVRTKCLTGLV